MYPKGILCLSLMKHVLDKSQLNENNKKNRTQVTDCVAQREPSD